jgi:hypothetical protein|tara:strand:+ start:868 stop:1137 length:270 start_codon:yes stop_codon:yes gene_type:complete
MIHWHTEKKIRWHMGFMPFAKFCISKLIKKIYKDGYYDGVAFAKTRNKIIRSFDDISMTPSQWITTLRLTQKIDNEGRKILFVEGVKIK